MLILDLIYNLAVLVALSVLSGIIDRRYNKNTTAGKILQGLLFGSISVVGMIYSFQLSEGIIFDGRTVVISLCTLFFGPIAGAISSLIAIAYRIHIAGYGLAAGILSVADAYIIALLFHHYTTKKDRIPSAVTLLLLGISVHIAMVLSMFALPSDAAKSFFRNIAPTVLLTYPIITLLIGKVLSNEQHYMEALKHLKASDKRYQTFLDADKNIMFLKDLQFRYMMCNKAMADFFKLKPEEIIGKTDFEIMPEPYAKMCYTSDRAVIETNSVVVVTELFDDKIFEITKFPVVVSENEKYIGGIIVDITEAKQMYEAVQLAKNRYEETLETVRDGIYEIKLPEGQIFASENFFKLLGYKITNPFTLEEFMTVVHPDDRKHLKNELESSARTGNFFFCDIRLEKQNGEIMWISVRGKPVKLNFETGRARIVGTVSDISERKEFEKQLEDKIFQLEKFNKFLIDRELRMVELKKEINALLQEAGRPPKYKVEPKNKMSG